MRWWLAALCVGLAGCGYVGDPLPPALNIPIAVQDLRVVQRGGRAVLTFTAPALTTDGLAIRAFEEVDLRIGPVPAVMSMDTWAAGARAVPAEVEPGATVQVDAPVSEWVGREVLASVRVRGVKGRISDWSNPATLAVRKVVAAPGNVKVEPHREGVRVSWSAVEPGASYRVYRNVEGAEPVVLGTVSALEFVDRGASLGRPLFYSVQAVVGGSESEPSVVVSVVPRDVFPPAVPAGLTAIAGVGSVELTWERVTDADLRGYRVYRNGELLADGVEAPAYSDRQVNAGTVYKYEVASVDRVGNESGRSAVVEVAGP